MALIDLESEVTRLCPRPDEVLKLTGEVALHIEELVREISHLNDSILQDMRAIREDLGRMTTAILAMPGEMRYPLSERGHIGRRAVEVDMHVARRYELMRVLQRTCHRALPHLPVESAP